MKGIVFTEFLEMVEERFSSEMADDILESAVLESGGAYTAVGTYDHQEMVRLVDQLSAKTGIPADNLLREFGERLFGRFEVRHRAFFAGVDSAFGFLKSVEGHIHVEVRKLYPDAELPSFECGEPAPGQLAMVYRSSRPFSALAEGLIKGCAAHFGETIDIQSERLRDGRGTRFLLTKRPQP